MVEESLKVLFTFMMVKVVNRPPPTPRLSTATSLFDLVLNMWKVQHVFIGFSRRL